MYLPEPHVFANLGKTAAGDVEVKPAIVRRQHGASRGAFGVSAIIGADEIAHRPLFAGPSSEILPFGEGSLANGRVRSSDAIG
jgi:hypothetical protein